MKIEMSKQYKSNGRPVRVLCVDAPGELPVLTMDEYGSICFFTPEGSFYKSQTVCEHDLVEVTPYDDFKIDDPVFVKFSDCGSEYRRHFAGVDSKGIPQVFSSGTTSWTNESVGTYPVVSVRPTENNKNP